MAEAPRNTPEVDDFIKKAKEQEKLDAKDFDASDFAVVVDNVQELADKAKVMLETKEQRQHLLDLIELEEKEEANKDVVLDGREKLTALREEITAQMNRPEVQDLEPEADPTKPKTLVDQIKSGLSTFGGSTIGLIVRGWINAQRMLIDLGVMKGDTAQLNKIEELYGTWFGAAETRDQVKDLLKAGEIEIRKGGQDGLAYARLQSDYLTALAAKMERKGVDGKPLTISPAEQAAIKNSFPFKAYLETKVKDYVKANSAPTPAGKKRVTTLMGISNSEKPSVQNA